MLRRLEDWWHNRRHAHADYKGDDLRIHACLPSNPNKQAIIFVVPTDPELFPLAITGTGQACFSFTDGLIKGGPPLTPARVTMRVMEETVPGGDAIHINGYPVSHRVLRGNA